MEERRRAPSPRQLVIVVLIVLAVAVPSLLHLVHSKVAANESMARDSMHAYNLALWEYFTIYETYPKTLANLGPGAKANVASADLIDPVLASGQKSGYVFAYVPGELDFDGTTSTFNITATPKVVGLTGRQSFSMDQTGVVHEATKPAAASSATPLLKQVLDRNHLLREVGRLLRRELSPSPRVRITVFGCILQSATWVSSFGWAPGTPVARRRLDEVVRNSYPVSGA